MGRKILHPPAIVAVLAWDGQLDFRGEILTTKVDDPFGWVYRVKALSTSKAGEIFTVRHSQGSVIAWPAHDLFKGTRVVAHPATDAWMSGDRYGTVIQVGTKYIHVRMDRSKKVRRFHPANISRLTV